MILYMIFTKFCDLILVDLLVVFSKLVSNSKSVKRFSLSKFCKLKGYVSATLFINSKTGILKLGKVFFYFTSESLFVFEIFKF